MEVVDSGQFLRGRFESVRQQFGVVAQYNVGSGRCRAVVSSAKCQVMATAVAATSATLRQIRLVQGRFVCLGPCCWGQSSESHS